MKVKEIMTTEVITIRPSAKIYELTRLLGERKISGVPVVDETNRLVGIVSETDLLALKSGDTVEMIMTREIITISEEANIEEVAALFVNKKINRVPVLREGKLCGIVTRGDLIAALARVFCSP